MPDIRLISNDGYPVPAENLANVRYPANYRLSGYKALKISRISVIRILSISGIRPDIENCQISGPTLLFTTITLTELINHLFTKHEATTSKQYGHKIDQRIEVFRDTSFTCLIMLRNRFFLKMTKTNFLKAMSIL